MFKKNVNQRIQNSLVLIIFPGRIFSPWSWLIRTTILDRLWFGRLLLSLLLLSSDAEKFLWMDDVLLLLSYWKPFVLGLFSSRSSSSSSPKKAIITCNLSNKWRECQWIIIVYCPNKKFILNYRLHFPQQEGCSLLFCQKHSNCSQLLHYRHQYLHHSLEKLEASSNQHPSRAEI